MKALLGVEKLTAARWADALNEAFDIQQVVCEQVYLSRKKDYDNPFRKATFSNAAEMRAVVGRAADSDFVKRTRKETDAFAKRIRAARRRG